MKKTNIYFLVCILFIPVSSFAKEWKIAAGFEGFEYGEKALGSGGFWGGAGWSEVVSSPALRNKAAKISIKKNHTAFGKWGGDWRFPDKVGYGKTIWFSVHTFFPEGFDYNSYAQGNRLKFLRIQTKNSEGKHLGYNDLYINPEGNIRPFRFIYEGTQRWTDVGIEKKHSIQRGVWENYQMAITFDSITKDDGGMAEILIWKNGDLVGNITNKQTLTARSDYADRALLFTYWNGGAPQTQSMYVDEIVLTDKVPEWHDNEGRSIVPYFTDACRLPN